MLCVCCGLECTLIELYMGSVVCALWFKVYPYSALYRVVLWVLCACCGKECTLIELYIWVVLWVLCACCGKECTVNCSRSEQIQVLVVFAIMQLKWYYYAITVLLQCYYSAIMVLLLYAVPHYDWCSNGKH